MSNYFDYILESSSEDIEDVDVIYNEYEMTIDEFNLYVQEGVGTKILVGLGIAALIGLVIGAIVKLVSNKSETSVSSSIARAMYMSEVAKKYGVENVEFDGSRKRGWLSDRGLRIFNVIESVCAAYADQMRKMISDLETIDDNAPNVEEISKKLFAGYEEALSQAKRRSNGHLQSLNREIHQFDIPTADTDRKRSALVSASEKDEWGGFGEKTKKSIDSIDDRLGDLKDFKNAFKDIGKELQELQRRAKELEKNKPNLMSKVSGNMSSEFVANVIKYVEMAHAILKESSDAIYEAIKIQIEDDKKRQTEQSENSSDSTLEEKSNKNRVDVKDLMNGTVDFDDFMSNPNSQMIFS